MSTAPESTSLILVPDELEKAVVATGLAPDGAQTLRSAFAPHFVKFHELAASAANVPANLPKVAGALRLELKKVRVAAGHTRKELKEDSLRRGKAIDGINALLEYQLVPIEDAMEKIEKAAEIAEANRIAALKDTRTAELKPYMDATFIDLGRMPDDQWEHMLAGAKTAYEIKLAAEAKAEADRVAAAKAAEDARLAKEAADAAERERMRAENERLAKVAAEERTAREAAEKAAAAERAAAEIRARREREAAEEVARKERARVEAERLAAEKAAAAALAASEAKAAAERAEAERLAQIESDRVAALEAELAAKAKAEKAAKAAAAKAARKAAAAPDREKLSAYAVSIASVQLPAMTTEEGAALLADVGARVAALAEWVTIESASLENRAAPKNEFEPA